MRFEQLSPVERTIFFGIANNKLNKQLAAQLGSCERTVKAQRARMMGKLQIHSLPDLVRASKLLEALADEEKLAPEDEGAGQRSRTGVREYLGHEEQLVSWS